MTEITAKYSRTVQISDYEPVTESATFERELPDDADDEDIREEYRRLNQLAEEEVERALANRLSEVDE